MDLPISDVGETAPAAPAEAIRPWSPAKRVGFRFGFAYLLLYCLPGSGTSSIFAGLPWIEDWLESVAAKPWIALWHWVAVHIFHLSGAVTMPHPTGSGDTTLSYIQTFCNLVIAVVAALVWTALDRRRTQYQTLYAWLDQRRSVQPLVDRYLAVSNTTTEAIGSGAFAGSCTSRPPPACVSFKGARAGSASK